MDSLSKDHNRVPRSYCMRPLAPWHFNIGVYEEEVYTNLNRLSSNIHMFCGSANRHMLEMLTAVDV